MSDPRLLPGKRAAFSPWFLHAEWLKGAGEEQSSNHFTPTSLSSEPFSLCRDMLPFHLETALQKESLLAVLTSLGQSEPLHGLASLSGLIVCSSTHLTAPTQGAFLSASIPSLHGTGTMAGFLFFVQHPH